MAFAVTYPETLEVVVGERLDLSVDFTNVIAAGDAISHPSVTITNAANNETVPTAITNVTNVGNILTFTLSSAPLRPHTTYIASFSATVSSLGALYFETLTTDNPLHYYRLDETASPFFDYGSFALNGVSLGTPTLLQPPLAHDNGHSVRFVNNPSGIDVPHSQRGNGLDNNCGPLNVAWEAWISPTGIGPDYPGFGNASTVFTHAYDTSGFPSAMQALRVKNGVDLYWSLTSQPFAGGNAAGNNQVLGCTSLGGTYHVVLKYLAGNFDGDGNPIVNTGTASLWVNAIKVGEWTIGSFRPFIFAPVGGPPIHMQIGHFKPFDTGDNRSDIVVDEFALYGNYTIGLDPLPDYRIAAHYANGIATLPASYVPVPPGMTPETSLATINLIVEVVY